MSVVIDSDNNNVNITEEPINVTVSLGGPDVAAVWGGITGDLTDQTDLQAVLDDKVPYTGATGDVNLGEYGIQLGNLEFDNTPTNVPTSAGSVYWSDTDGTLNMVLKGGNTISRIGETQHIRALNNTGVQIARGKVVYVVGAQGQRLTIALADADTEILSKDTIGITSEDIADGAEGFVIVQGVINNVNTNGMADGATVYLSQTAGGYTTTPPVDPAHLVILGFIVNGNSGGAGSIYVKVDNGYELGELHDVNTTGATNGQVLTYNGTTWVAATNGSGTVTSIATSAPITGGTITTSGTIGITQAGAAADGYLSSTDWNTFNNKQAALSLTTTGTSGAATLVGSTLNIPQYQAVLTNPVTGTGTAGQVSYWSGTGTQTGSNNLFWDAVNGRLGVGINVPNRTLDVRATGLAIASVRGGTSVGQGAGFFAAKNNGGTMVAIGDESTMLGTDPEINAMILTGTSVPLRFHISGGEAARITTSRNFIINNSASDNGQRLQVYGSTLLRGSGTTSATTALLVQNSTPSNLFQITDNGVATLTPTTLTGSEATSALDISQTWNTTGTPTLIKANVTNTASAGLGRLFDLQVGGSSIFYVDRFSQIVMTSHSLNRWLSTTANENGISFSGTSIKTSGEARGLSISGNFSTSSGNSILSLALLTGVINQTGGANGITRGLYVNPTLTSAADWRSVEFSNNTGWGLYGAGTANNYLGGSLGMGTTTPSNSAIRSLLPFDATRINGIYSDGAVTSNVTTIVNYTSRLRVNNSITTTSYFHYLASEISFGAGASLTNQYGYYVSSALTSATNNFGFVSDIASGTGRWNLYMNGTAANYLAGNTSIGTTTESARLLVRGSGTTSSTTALLVQNSTPTALMSVRDDGKVILGITTAAYIEVGTLSNFYNVSAGYTHQFRAGGSNCMAIQADGRLDFIEGGNIQIGTTTGTKIGTATSQKIGLWNATPIVQPTTAIAAATRIGGGGTTVTDTDTFDGYTIAQIVKALRNIGALA